jgi:transcriptional regulator with XRE-family HTH domain
MLADDFFAGRGAAKGTAGYGDVASRAGLRRGEMARSQRPEPYLPPGPARDLVDLFRRLRESSQLRVGQIANRTGYAPSHVSEVLRGRKAPSPDAAGRIAQALGADASTVRRARRRAEDLMEWKRDKGGRADPALVSFPIRHQLSSPNVTISIVVGNLFDQDTHLAVGFSDTFDTSVAGDRVIHSSSVQGQLLRQLFAGDQHRLDADLDAALAPVAPMHVESRREKPYGKLARYPLGTVAVLGEPRRLIFAVAYGRMGNDLVVRAPVEDLWGCYARLWEAVYRHGQRGPLSIPLMGSGLARVDTLDRENLIQLILLSFVAYSRHQLICHDLRVVIFPDDVRQVDPANLRAFLQTL